MKTKPIKLSREEKAGKRATKQVSRKFRRETKRLLSPLNQGGS